MSDDATTNDFSWGPLGAQWWHQARADTKASAAQTRFACVWFGGGVRTTRTFAARAAGYQPDPNGSFRKAGSEAARSRAVTTLMTLAAAAFGSEIKAGPPGVATSAEIKQKLSDLMRGSDPSLALRAASDLAKLVEAGSSSNGAGPFSIGDGFDQDRLYRDWLRVPGGGAAIALMHSAAGFALSSLPMLRDVHQAVLDDAPEVWDLLRRRESEASRISLDRLLADPNWQASARAKVWAEIGVTLVNGAPVDLANIREFDTTDAPAMQASARGTQAAVGPDARSTNGANGGRYARD